MIVSGSRASRTYHPVPARTARYVRLSVTSPTNDGNNAGRVYELEVYGPAGGLSNVALGRPATADSSCNANETADKAFNGSVSGGLSDKWCSGGSAKWLQVDLGSTKAIRSFILRNAGAGGETSTWDTRDADLLVSNDGTTWTTAAQIRGNTVDVTTVNLASPANGRYVRLNVLTPTQTSDAAARIYELEVYA